MSGGGAAARPPGATRLAPSRALDQRPTLRFVVELDGDDAGAAPAPPEVITLDADDPSLLADGRADADRGDSREPPPPAEIVLGDAARDWVHARASVRKLRPRRPRP